jgi:hypothetical protein
VSIFLDTYTHDEPCTFAQGSRDGQANDDGDPKRRSAAEDAEDAEG